MRKDSVRLWVRSQRCYLRYLAQMTVHENTDSTNKRNYDVTLGSVLRHNFALSALLLPRIACGGDRDTRGVRDR